MVPLNVEFHSERDLYLAFMPFLKEGGVFVRTPRQYDLGDEVELHILLPDALEESSVQGEVCWLTPILYTLQDRSPARPPIACTWPLRERTTS